MKNLLQRIPNSSGKQLILLLAVWMLIQIAVGFTLGIRPNLESLKYIREANNLLETGSFSAPRFIFYGFTTFVIAIGFKIGVGFPFVVALQLLWNLAALICWFFALSKTEKTKGAAFITALVLMFCIPYQTWNFYLYTESFFYSNTLLFFAACIHFQKRLTTSGIILQLFVLAFAIVSRPLGILLLPCWLLYIMIQIQSKRGRALFTIALATGGGISLFIINTILSTISDWSVLRPFAEGHVICDMPGNKTLDLGGISKGAPLIQLCTYLLNYPGHFIILASERIFAFFFLIRSYYSNAHNFFLIFMSLILYIPLIPQLVKRKMHDPTFYLSFVITIFFATTIAFQCDDYHNRFYLTLVPMLLHVGLFRAINSTKPIK
ncbi:hypothetical protein [Paracnuella aquatica]|uniref:hypothetical protein n=1 Tax=Paracnuella aquatica TaxID=2268757 RepID=UPI000DEFE874|nr:hypothetical protein [Paracnuella aquatica]RPD50729.1 hypothetical protein DRJ53_07355 [Paracnuella aquatica]